ncbi:MAG: lytic transglycosylase domain-containing protein [Alphaproteobacteria bacterium]|nr:lytic transglycosylase domain-containing protein [Alphaproteobacteria bacterium]
MLTRRGFLNGLVSSVAVLTLPMVNPALAAPSGLAVQAVQRALSGDFTAAGTMAAQSGDAAAVKLVELLFLRDNGTKAGYKRILDFLNAAPKWPLTETLLKRAEQALFENNQDAQTVLGYFASRQPLTAYGMLALARSQFASGDASKAKAWLRKAWGESAVDAALEQKVIAEFGGKLSAADHQYRFSRLVFAQQANAAIRNAKRLGGDYVSAAYAAQALINGQSSGEAKYNSLSSTGKSNMGVKFALARYYRKQEKYGKARALLASIPSDSVAMGDSEAWWTERKIVTLHSVGPNHADSWNAAYKIARNHGCTNVDNAVEGEFMAGWVALRYLKKPAVALTHFTKLQQLAPTRTEKARAAYWIGRTYLAIGDKATAKLAFKDGAQYTTVYYGQLSREQIGLGNKPEEITGGGSSAAAQARIEQDEVIRAFRIMAQAGTKNQLNIFLWSLANRFKSVDDMNAVANVVQTVAGTSWALRFAKAAGQRGIDIDSWSYPVRGLPNWQQIGKPIEKSLVFALSRQESEFDPNAGSSVGAQGLMQLMPGTARLVARQYKLSFKPSSLKSDPSYNVKLGAAHLADLVDEFNGSYILTLVAYNAGPRRSREWLDEYGDPRGGQVDAVDWVECIPFNETRQYVQKVMQNLHVYRSRLAPETVRPMTADLKRGTPSDVTVASTSTPAPAHD